MERIATTTGRALSSTSAVHYAKPGRFGGIVTLCNGRTIGMAFSGAGAVTCKACIKAEANGKISVPEGLRNLSESGTVSS
jgi:hypothetical protein